MNTLLWWLAQNTLTIALLIPVVVGGCRLCRNRPAVAARSVGRGLAQVRHAAHVLLAMASAAVQRAQASPAGAALSNRDERLAFVSDDVPAGMGAPHTITTVPGQTTFSPVERHGRSASVGGDHLLSRLVLPFLAVVWLAGIAVCIGLQVRRITWHASLVRKAKNAPERLAREIQSMALQLGVRPPQALVTRDVVSPFMWCLGRLRLLWPEAMSSCGEIVRSRGVIAHELAHVRRGDHILAWVELSAGFIWWWNPLFWFVRRRLRESAELACDAIAVSACPGSRRAYAELLLELSSDPRCAALAPALGIKAGTASSFERRFSMILSDRVSGRLPLWGFVAAGALSIAALPAWSAGPVAAAQTEPPASKIEVPRDQKRAATAERLKQIEAELRRLSVLLEEAKQSALKQPHQPASPTREDDDGRGLEVIEKSPVSVSMKGTSRQYLVFTENSAARVRAFDKVGRLLWDCQLPRTLQLAKSSEWNINEALGQNQLILTWKSDGNTHTCHLDMSTGRLINEEFRSSDFSEQRAAAQLSLARAADQMHDSPSLADRLRALNTMGSEHRKVLEHIKSLELGDHDLTQSIFRCILHRDPRADELDQAMKHLSTAFSRSSAIEDIVWVLINSRDYQASPIAPTERR